MEEIEAKYKKEAAEERLLMGLGTLRALINGPADRRPETKLRRELSGARMLWDKFDMLHFGYMRVLLLEQSKVIEREAFKESYETAHGIFEQVEELLDALAPAPAAVPPRQFIGNDILYAIAKQEQESFYGNATEKVDSVETCLAPAADEGAVRSEYRQELEQLGKELDQSEEHMKAAAMLTKEMNKLTPREAAENIRQEAETVRELSKKIDKQRRAIARKLATVAVPEAAGGTGKNKMGSDTYMYTRRPMPKFDGQKRNYPAFRREWQTGITGRFDADYEVREIKLNVPAEVEPDIKNLTTMAGVWSVLDARYGKVMELTKELISGLQCFAFSRQATNDSAKFLELHNEFVKVYNDLEQIDRLSVLNHEPTLCTLAKQLPSDDSKMRYTKLRLRRLEENDEAVARVIEGAEPVGVLSNLDIMNEFMRKEREIQVNYGQLLRTEDSAVKSTDGRRTGEGVAGRGGGAERCHVCDMPGHKARDCPSQVRRGVGGRIAHYCYECDEDDHETSECNPAFGGGDSGRFAHHCYRCNDDGHKTSQCTSKFGEGGGSRNAREVVSHANTHIKPKDCPACHQQHSFTLDDGAVRYKNRLSNCPTFRQQMSPGERANLMEKINGCALCTDWTGSHRREQCEERDKAGHKFSFCREEEAGGRCGRNHHVLLHGNTTKFANFVKREVPPGLARVLAGKLPSEDTNRLTKMCMVVNKLTSFKANKFKTVNKVTEPEVKQGKAEQKFWRPWEEAECKEVIVVGVRLEPEEVVKSKVKIQQTISKDPIKRVMERVNKKEEMSFVFEESERESVEVRKKMETLNIKNRQRGLLKVNERHDNVIKCEERLSKAVPAASAVAGEREAEKWVVVRRRTARWRR